MLDDADDLFGAPVPYVPSPVPPKKGTGRPPGRPKGSPNTATLIKRREDARTKRLTDGKAKNYSHTPDREALLADDEITSSFDDVGTSIKLSQIQNGVPIPFLAHVFRKSQHITKERLRSVTPIRYGKNGAFFYDLFEAAEALVDPKVDIGEYMKSIKIEDLPNHLQDNYWKVKQRRQDYEEKARELWHVQDVREVIGDTFRTIRNAIQLFGDNLDSKAPLSPAHRKLLREMLNVLQQDIRDGLEENIKKKSTRSQIKELDGLKDV